MASAPKRKLWSDVSMAAAVKSVLDDNNALRQAARLHNVPIETLRRRVNGSVEMNCKPGPGTVLTEEEEEKLSKYLVQMADMGFGLTREGVMGMAYAIVEKSQRNHPFKNGMAGRSWFEGFMSRHPKLSIRTPQPLSYCRALNSNYDTLMDFFGKLGSIYGRLNLITKPMQIYNCDESGVSIVFKPGKVVAELGRKNVYAVSAADRGKTHTIMACVSASGYVLPPMMIYPRKKAVPDNFREGAYPNTLFESSESGWMNGNIFIKWFNFFVENIPPSRPVLLIMDGHGSHISIELIELARANGIHLLCLPSHTSHLLQPLDVGVFKSFKSYFNKACTQYMKEYPGRVITADILASMVAKAFSNSLTPVNIMGGFKRSGVWPINPGEATDRRIDPSTALRNQSSSKGSVASPTQQDVLTQSSTSAAQQPSSNGSVASSANPTEQDVSIQSSSAAQELFSPEKETLFAKRFEEQYDVFDDPEYVAWLKINHPEFNVSGTLSDISSNSTGKSGSHGAAKSNSDVAGKSDVLSDILVFPKPKERPQRKGRKAVNHKAICITEEEVLEQFKNEQKEKMGKEAKKAENKVKRERNRIEREEKKRRKDERARTKKESRKNRGQEEGEESDCEEKKRRKGERARTKKESRKNKCQAEQESEESDCEQGLGSSVSDEEAICPSCGISSMEVDDLWVLCDGCQEWYDFKCTKIKTKKQIPNTFYCKDCIK